MLNFLSRGWPITFLKLLFLVHLLYRVILLPLKLFLYALGVLCRLIAFISRSICILFVALIVYIIVYLHGLLLSFLFRLLNFLLFFSLFAAKYYYDYNYNQNRHAYYETYNQTYFLTAQTWITIGGNRSIWTLVATLIILLTIGLIIILIVKKFSWIKRLAELGIQCSLIRSWLILGSSVPHIRAIIANLVLNAKLKST